MDKILYSITEEKLTRACIPRRFWEAQITDVQDQVLLREMDKSIRLLKRMLFTGVGMMIIGPLWSGKTAFASIMLRTAMSKGKEVLYCRSCDLQAEWRKSDAEDPFSAHFLRADLVVVDDLGLEAGDARTMKFMEYIFRRRFEDGRCTVVVSNYTKKELEKLYTITFMSVLDRACRYIFVLDTQQWLHLAIDVRTVDLMEGEEL